MKIPKIRFEGCEYAHDMGRIFAENLADLLAKVDDGGGTFPRGFMHTSTIPHAGTCYYDQVWARDAGRGVQEMARYGFVEQARMVVEYFLANKNFGDHWGRIIDRHIGEDYELDGNTHILNAIAQTWRAAGKDITLGRYYLKQTADVFAWFARCMEACPIGDLLPCISELSGNPCIGEPVYAIYPNYGAYVAVQNFADLAAFCGEHEIAKDYAALAQKLMASVERLLISNGDVSDTRVPGGVWLNGRTVDGRPYETAFFGAHFNIHCWTRQAPYIQNYDAGVSGLYDDDAKDVHLRSYAYLRHAMAKGYYFRRYGFVSNTCWGGAGGRHDDTMCGYGQNYFTQASLLVDDVNTYGKALEGVARLAYDGDVIEPATFEMNPFVMHECFEYDNYEKALDHTFGKVAVPDQGVMDNPGDEGNLVQSCETLKTLAIVAGVSMKDGVLIVKPRLPWKWDEMELCEYPVVDSDGTIHRIHLEYKHERWARLCTVRLLADETAGKKITTMRVRFGPFAPVLSTMADVSAYEKEVNDRATFLWQTGGLVQSIEV
ncbi:MAG: hypothetical protein IJW40_10730 [Clostridia bacterium]|nr:hypothetical protein [Clostridia bacterium]